MKDRNRLIYFVTISIILIAYFVIYIYGVTARKNIYDENDSYQHNLPKQPTNNILSIMEDRSIMFDYDDMGNYIDLRNQFPTKDEVGISFEGNKYTQDFKLRLNRYATNVAYVITLVKIAGSNLEDEWTKVYLESDSVALNSVFRPNGRVKTFNEYLNYYGRSNEKILYSGIISAKEAQRGYKKFTLKMWVSEDLEVYNEDYQNKYFKSNIKVYAVRY